MKRLRLFLFGFISISFFVAIVRVGLALELPANIWGEPKQLTLLEPVSDPTSVIDPVRSCTDQTVVVKPFLILPSFPFVQTEQTLTSCFTNTSNGLLDGRYFLAKNTGIAGKITSDQSPNLLPVPNSEVIFHTQSLPYPAFYLKAYRDPLSKMTAQISSTKEVAYKLSGPADTAIADKAGNKLPIIPSSMAYSKNGKWLTADMPGMGSVRVNLESFEVLPFGYKSTYFEGSDPAIRTAISNDGRYAVAYSTRNNSYFSVFDLTTCEAIPDRILKPVSCSETNLAEFVRSQAPAGSTHMSVQAVTFTDTDTLQLYLGYRPGGGATQTGKYLLKAGAGTAFNTKYLALGDSFSSGEGAHDYEAYTDIPENRCHLSKQSYPYVLARSAGFNDFHSVACSGAKTRDVIDNSNEYNRDKIQGKGKVSDLFNNEIFTNFLPGYRAQLFFLQYNPTRQDQAKLQPEAITLTNGGNDVGFDDIIKLCVQPDTCYATREARLEKAQEISRQFDNLVQAYNTVKDAAPKSRIYILGYPKITSLNEKCGINVRLDANELDFADKLVAYLNTVIRQAAKKAGVFYVDIEESLTDTALCSGADDANISVNGITAGNDKLPGVGPLGNESYHPNQRGHNFMSQVLASKTENLTKPMPQADSSAIAPSTEDLPFVLSAPATGRSTRYLVNDPEMTLVEQINRGEDLDFELRSNYYLLQPLSNAEVLIYSTPTSLGTLPIDAKGQASGTFEIPSSLEPGFHTLHIMATNIAGEPVDLYKGIYIAASENDFDGDGVVNEQDDCWLTKDLGIDIDQDGLDDGCDPDISEPPTQEPSPISIPNPVTPDPNDPKNQLPTYSDPFGSLTPTPSDSSLEQQTTNTPPVVTRQSGFSSNPRPGTSFTTNVATIAPPDQDVLAATNTATPSAVDTPIPVATTTALSKKARRDPYILLVIPLLLLGLIYITFKKLSGRT